MSQISVCITAYNEGDQLFETVRSVYAHADELDEMEVIVVDDGGTDGSGERVRDEFPVVYFKLSGPNGTPAKAHGPTLATGDVLVFLDGHCRLTTGALEKMQTGAQRYGIVNPVIRGLDSEGKINGTRCNLSCFGRDELQTKYMRSKHAVKLDSKSWKTWRIAVGACAIRRDIYHNIGGIDAGVLSFGVDSSLTLRAWCAGYDIALLMDTEIGHLFRKNFRPGTSPHWAQLYANQLRIVATVGDEDDMRERHKRLSEKMKDAYRKAVELFEANSVPLPVIEQKRTLKEYWAETGQEAVYE